MHAYVYARVYRMACLAVVICPFIYVQSDAIRHTRGEKEGTISIPARYTCSLGKIQMQCVSRRQKNVRM